MEESNNFLGKVIFSKYQIKALIGKGQYSEVYLAENVKNKKLYAAKIEKKGNRLLELLENESYFLLYLKGFGIPEIVSYGRRGKYNILIQQLLGKTLKDLFKQNTNKIKDLCMASIQLIDRIKYIHSKYIIHRDIKPDNFLVGNPDISTIYLIDFGFARKYRSSKTKKHIAYKVSKYIPGTVGFLSINGTNGIEPTRRDDLESLAYSLIYLGIGALPWSNIKAKTFYERSLKIYNTKKNILIDDLCKGLPKEFMIFTEYVRNLKFEEEPDYNFLQNLFIDFLKKIDKKNDSLFSWISQNDRNRYINVSRRTYSNNLSRRKSTPRKRILESLEKLRTNSNEINDKFIKNSKHNVYTNIINYNNKLKIEKPALNLAKTNNLYEDIKKGNREKYIKKEIKINQNTSQSQVTSTRMSLNKISNKQTIPKNRVIHTNKKIYTKSNLVIKTTNYQYYTNLNSPDNSTTNRNLSIKLNNNSDYIPQTKKIEFTHKNFKLNNYIVNRDNLNIKKRVIITENNKTLDNKKSNQNK